MKKNPPPPSLLIDKFLEDGSPWHAGITPIAKKPRHMNVMPAKAGIHEKPLNKAFVVGPAVDPGLRRDDKGKELGTLDRKDTRRLSRGHHDIDARLDLHGMRQAPAQVAVKKFLMRCHAAGLKNLLVITGKGRVTEPGVLRAALPEWISYDADLNKIVRALTPAAPNHGGTGAFYVTLKK